MLFGSIKLLIFFFKVDYLWSIEIFKEFRILDTTPTTYPLSHMKDDEILSDFYHYKFRKDKNTEIYHIENILKNGAHRGKRQLIVRWLGYNSDLDTWIAAKDIHNPQ